MLGGLKTQTNTELIVEYLNTNIKSGSESSLSFSRFCWTLNDYLGRFLINYLGKFHLFWLIFHLLFRAELRETKILPFLRFLPFLKSLYEIGPHERYFIKTGESGELGETELRHFRKN